MGEGSAGCKRMSSTAQGEGCSSERVSLNSCQQILTSFSCASLGIRSEGLTESFKVHECRLSFIVLFIVNICNVLYQEKVLRECCISFYFHRYVRSIHSIWKGNAWESFYWSSYFLFGFCTDWMVPDGSVDYQLKINSMKGNKPK